MKLRCSEVYRLWGDNMPTVFLYEEVYNTILKKIVTGEYRPNETIPSESEFCNMLNVSLITVRRALKDLEQQGIIKKQRGKGSTVNENIRKIDTVYKNKNIGILDIVFEEQVHNIYPDPPFDKAKFNQNLWKNKIYSTLYDELKDEYNLLLSCYSKKNALEDFDNTIFKDLDRIFIIDYYDKEILDFLYSKNKLVVVYNNFDKNAKVCSVSNDERDKFREVTLYLIKNGHKKIAAINGSIVFSESVERSMGYQEALFKNNISIDMNLIKWGNMSSESGYFLMKDILNSGNIPTAVVCVNDNVAVGAIFAIEEYGLKCPEDISIIGHDNNELLCEIISTEITSVDPNFQGVGKKIAEIFRRDIWLDDSSVVEGKIIFKNSIAKHN